MALSPRRRALSTLTVSLFLAAPLAAERAPRQVALDHLASRAGELGLVAGDLADLAVTDEYQSAHNGLTHVWFRQRVNQLEIVGTEMGIHVDRQGRVIHQAGSFVREVLARAQEVERFPRLTADEAIVGAGLELGLRGNGSPELLAATFGPDRAARYAAPSLSDLPIPVRLNYFRAPDSDQLTLTWNLSLRDPGSSHWWDVHVDAASGKLVSVVDWTSHASYRVFAQPKESPLDGARTDEVDPHLDGGTGATGASPFGWHDLNGVAGAETTLTSGNNVNACADVSPDNICDAGSQPDGGGGLVFQPDIDLSTEQPADYLDSAVVNLYYWNNIMHDVLYQYGFDDPAGNFQENNYGRGGLGSDSVNADAQDGSGTNNANFGTPPDGSNPRMQMFIWTAPKSLTINAPGPVAGDYTAGSASFGPQVYNLTDDVVLVNDGSGAVTDDGCCLDGNTLCVAPVWPGVSGNIALLRRGQCEFGTKTVNAQNAGAVGVILINNQGTGPVVMGPGVNGGAATIPILSLSTADGNLLVANQSGLNATMDSTSTIAPNRDSDLDNGVIAHEYGHGVSNRLTGGPSTTSCLSNAEQMGEGWSDWMGLFLNAAPADTRTTLRTTGGYVNFDGPLGIGIRRFPYTTDNGVNPLDYGDVADPANTQPHGIGTIWATMLWEMYWNLVDQMGYDPDIYNGTGGNNIAFQLSIDGMKLQPCSPGFEDGRDAILAADVANYEGENSCDIWRAFAERGMGLLADQGASNNRSDGIEDFTLPPACVNLIFADGFGMGSAVRWSVEVP